MKITTSKGKSLYVNRLARGVSYDVLWVSASDGRCHEPSYEKDIVLHSHAGYPLYYNLLPDGTVLLYLQGEAKVPRDFPVPVRQENVHPLDWDGVEARHAAGEIRRLNINFSKSDDCSIGWW